MYTCTVLTSTVLYWRDDVIFLQYFDEVMVRAQVGLEVVLGRVRVQMYRMYAFTVQNVRYYSAECTLLQYRMYAITVQNVRYYSTECTLLQCGMYAIYCNTIPRVPRCRQ